MSRATAQIVVTLDPETGEFRAEIPAPNGSRRKVALPQEKPQFWGSIIQQELTELNIWLGHQEREVDQAPKRIKEAQIRFDRALHQRIWDNSAQTRGQGTGFANEKFGSRAHPAIKIKSIAEMLKELKF